MAAAPTDEFPRLFLMTNSFETGGSERQFAALARSLKASSFRLGIGCMRRRGGFLEGLEDVLEFPVGGNLYGLPSMQTRLRLARYLRDSDTVVAQAFDFYANLLLIPAARLARVPVVIGSQRQLGDLLTSKQFHAQLAMFRLCDRVVCNSRAAADRLAQAGLSEDKLVVVGNGLPASAFAETAPALVRREGVLRVGMIARMNAAYKNHSMFLRAASRARRKFSNLEIVLVGDGPLLPELEPEAADLGLQGSVIFLGDRRDISAALACMDVSVVPSISESLSNVMLESMAAGVPVVATAVGGNIELASDGRALLVPPEDEEALAAGLERVLADQGLRAEMGRRARRFAQENFSMEQVRRQYLGVYAEVLAGKGKNFNKTAGRNLKANPSRAGSRIRVAVVAPSLSYVGGQ